MDEEQKKELNTPDGDEPVETAGSKEQLQAEIETQKEQYLRLAAEYDNFRKRTSAERKRFEEQVICRTLSEFLTVADDLDRAAEAEGSAEDIKAGLKQILISLKKSFSAANVEAFGETGESFDPNIHNAVQHVEAPELGNGVIAAVYQRGYKVGESIIRHAMVAVAN